MRDLREIWRHQFRASDLRGPEFSVGSAVRLDQRGRHLCPGHVLAKYAHANWPFWPAICSGYVLAMSRPCFGNAHGQMNDAFLKCIHALNCMLELGHVHGHP